MRLLLPGLLEAEEVVTFMGKHALVLSLLAFFLFGAATAKAEIYKWVDERGNVHFQDHPPPEVEKVSGFEVRDSSPRLPQELAPPPPAVAGSQGQAVVPSTPVESPRTTPRTAKVELYTVDWCPWCRKAREFFRTQGVPFTDYNIEKDAAAAARRNELDPKRGIPLALINGVKVKGYSPEAYFRALKATPPERP